MRIIIGGDICPSGRNQRYFQKGDASSLLGKLKPELESADLVIANLECPLINVATPIEKCGPTLSAPVECADGLRTMGIDVLGVANNHIMDHGAQGLKTTIQALENAGISHVGAGVNLADARKILVREIQGVRVGILALAEHEFGIASIEQGGAAPLDPIDAVRNIRANRSNFDRLVVLLHAGNEHYPYPRPQLMDICRFLVEQGANAVICQHSHCVGCMETYQGAPIVYGQGNFLFDYPSKALTWHDGVLICLDAEEGANFKIRHIPYRQSDGQPGLHLMTNFEEESFMNAFIARSETIRDESFVLKQWEIFCRQNKRYFLHSLHGKPGFLRRLLGKLDLLHYLDSREVQRGRLHLIRCESLREALVTVLSQEIERR